MITFHPKARGHFSQLITKFRQLIGVTRSGNMKARKLDSRNKKSEIINTLRVLVRYLRFWGVFPYKVKDFELVHTKLGVVLLIVNGIGLAIGVLSSFLADFGSQFISFFEAIQYPTLSLVSLLVFNVKYKSLKKLVGKLLGFGHEIDLDINELKKRLVKLVILVALVSGVFIPVLHIMTIYYRCQVLGPKFWERVMDWNYIFFAWSTNNFFLVQTVFVGLVFYIKECFFTINQKFIAIDLEKKISKINDPEVSTNLRSLIKLRQRLLDTTEEANRLFYPELVVWCWAILFEILYSSFYIVEFVIERDTTDPTSIIFVSYLPFWFGFQFFAVTYISYACDGLTVEVRFAIGSRFALPLENA